MRRLWDFELLKTLISSCKLASRRCRIILTGGGGGQSLQLRVHLPLIPPSSWRRHCWHSNNTHAEEELVDPLTHVLSFQSTQPHGRGLRQRSNCLVGDRKREAQPLVAKNAVNVILVRCQTLNLVLPYFGNTESKLLHSCGFWYIQDGRQNVELSSAIKIVGIIDNIIDITYFWYCIMQYS